MKLLKLTLPALVLATLGGCAVYPAPGYDSYGYGGGPYASEPPVTVYGGGSVSYGNSYGYPVPVPVYPHGYYEGRPPPRPYPGGYYQRPPEVHRPPPGPRPDAGPRPPNRSPRAMLNEYNRDRDGDGVPDRVDRDRDGDGVGNRNDRRPGNPRQR